nr:MAG TPA: hypothetical protein [Caudoviricetes sp.]
MPFLALLIFSIVSLLKTRFYLEFLILLLDSSEKILPLLAKDMLRLCYSDNLFPLWALDIFSLASSEKVN